MLYSTHYIDSIYYSQIYLLYHQPLKETDLFSDFSASLSQVRIQGIDRLVEEEIQEERHSV